uniref:G_PROTEIN_RECEP_F1_2 domain-containing protein n=1 Tax=Steinernema glaseri TaxID=37863 RepID=A0A1I7ZXJ4_9BILA
MCQVYHSQSKFVVTLGPNRSVPRDGLRAALLSDHRPTMATEVLRGAEDVVEFLRDLENSSHTTAAPMSDFYQWALSRQRNRGNASAAFFPAAAKSSVSLTKTSAVLLCDLLGAMCLFLNLFVLFALIRNRKRVLQNVFYVIVLHCAFVDIIRGTCLIIWGIPHLLIYNVPSMEYRLLALKINQIVLIILRSCNLLTIFNLLVFTTNEFIVIKYPLHYRRYFRRQTVVIMLICSWIISLTFGVGSVASNFFESAHSVLVLSDRNASRSLQEGSSLIRRRELDSVSVNMLSMVMIFALCYLCLFVVLVCYGAILRTIHRFHSLDSKGVFNSDDSQRIRSTKRLPEKESVQGASLKVNADGERCNSHRRWRNHLMSRHKYLIVIGSVLFVDVLFLFPYSGIQMVAFLHLNNVVTSATGSTIIRWCLQILIGVHSVIQPLCYFRMTEFRRLALCRKRRNVCGRSQSFSHMQRSYAQTKEQPMHTTHEDERLKEPNLDEVSGENDALLRRTSFDQMFLSRNWRRVESVKFRSYGKDSSPVGAGTLAAYREHV